VLAKRLRAARPERETEEPMLRMDILNVLTACAVAAGSVTACSGTSTPFLTDDSGAPSGSSGSSSSSGAGSSSSSSSSSGAGSSSSSGAGSSSSSGAGSSSSSGAGSSSSSSGAGGGCPVACSVASDCNACGAPQAGFGIWCCTSPTCYGWSSLPCPPTGSSSSSGGGTADAGGSSSGGGIIPCGATGQICCAGDAGAQCATGLRCRANGMCR
jgi:hypothetical protein